MEPPPVREPAEPAGSRGLDVPPSRAVAAFAWGGACLFVISLLWFLYAYLVRFGATPADGGRLPPIVLDVALFSGFALHHSLFARTSLKAWVRGHTTPVLERSLYTWAASLLLILVCSLWQPVPGMVYRLDAAWRWLGVAAQVAGLVLTFFGSKALDVLDLAGVRAVLRARGGAAPVHVPLLTSGVYGLVRHPLYFGWALFVCGAPDMTATRAVFAIVSTAYVAAAIPWEEQSLMATFGPAYAEYRTKVRSRMLPGVY